MEWHFHLYRLKTSMQKKIKQDARNIINTQTLFSTSPNKTNRLGSSKTGTGNASILRR